MALFLGAVGVAGPLEDLHREVLLNFGSPPPATDVTMAQPAYSLDEVRDQIPCFGQFIPLNHCSQAPPTRTTLGAAGRFLESWQRTGMDWVGWLEEVESARASFATLIGAGAGDVAIFSSVSHATAAVASALDFTGDRNRIVLTEAEFPTVAHVWGWQERRGAKLSWVPMGDEHLDEERLSHTMDSDVRIVSIAHGHYETGAILPVESAVARARELGAYSLLDGYQTLGARTFDVRKTPVDFVVCGALKYLMGVAGVAFLYVRPDVSELMEPETTGWFGRIEPFAFDAKRLDWAEGGRRFDSGTPPLLPAYIAGAGIDFLLDMGVPAIEEWVTRLTGRMIERAEGHVGLRLMGPRDPRERTCNTAFDCGEMEGHVVEARMREAGFVTSARGSAIRLAVHGYNSEDDVDRAIDALAGILSSS